MLIIFLIYAIIPVLIVINIAKTDNKKIRKCRLLYAVPAIILTIVNVIGFLYNEFYQKINFFSENPYAFLLPGLSLLLVLIVYNSGKKQEKMIQIEIASNEIDKVRNSGASQKRHNVIFSKEDEIEKL